MIPHIIHDQRNGIETLLWEMARQHIDHFIIEEEPWSNINPIIIINTAHKRIIQKAKDNGDEMVCVFEDDIMFPAKDGYDRFIHNIPDDFDLYLGGVYNAVIGGGRIRNFSGFHCYICHSRFYDKFIGVPSDVHIDNTVAALEGVFIVTYPYVALQRPGLSRNSQMWVDYNVNLKQEDIYSG